MSDSLSANPAEATAEPLFDVVFHGEILDGFELENVKASFAQLFKLSMEKVEQIFASSRVVLKPNINEPTAEKFQRALQGVGAQVSLESKSVKEELALLEEPSAEVEETASEPTDVTAESEVQQDEAVAAVSAEEPAAEANIYQAPEAELTHSASSDEYGSLERGISGDYQFSFGEILSEGWALVSGNKLTVFIAFLLYIAAYMGIAMGAGLVFGIPMAFMSDSVGMVGVMMGLQQLVIMLLGMPLWLGLAMVGVKLAIGAPAPAGSVFEYFGRMLSLFATVVLMYLLIAVGLLLLVIPGIYLMIAYSQAMLLVVDKGLSPWQALEASRKAVSHHWFGIFGLMFVLWFIVLFSMIPLGIGLIWTLPLVLISMGVIYRNMFGVSSVTVAE